MIAFEFLSCGQFQFRQAPFKRMVQKGVAGTGGAN